MVESLLSYSIKLLMVGFEGEENTLLKALKSMYYRATSLARDPKTFLKLLMVGFEGEENTLLTKL
jgi:hypothetical protein